MDESGVEKASSDYQSYLRQKSLNAVLTKSAVVSGAWFALGAMAVCAAVVVRPDADVVGMDPAGREHPIVLSEMPIQAAGVKR